MSATNPISDEWRAKGRELAQRLQSDPSFRQRVQGDPHGAMREAGLPEEAATDFLRETGMSAEVSGYAAPSDWCWVTCFITGPR